MFWRKQKEKIGFRIFELLLKLESIHITQTEMKGRIPFILSILIGAIVVFFFYSEVILHPNQYLFSDSGDGLKNYFTYAYYIQNNQGFIDFEGMNYPYGEHFLYTDCHPILASLFRFLGVSIPFFKTYAIGILNLLLIGSVWITFPLCYKLLRKLGIQQGLGLVFAVCMAMLAPQIFRINGHLSLSYSIAIPLSWLLFLYSDSEKRKRFWLLLLFLNNLFWLFIHAYLGIIVLFFLMALIIVEYAANKNRKLEWAKYAVRMSTVVMPLLLFFAFAKSTDTHTSRTENPSGFFQYNAELDDVLLPHHGPISAFIKAQVPAFKLKWEAWSYVGIIATLLLFVILISSIIALIRRRKSGFVAMSFSSREVNRSLIASGLILLFAMGIPFRQFPVLLDWLPVLKQFRTTGRFTWPFYFAAIVFVAFVFQGLYTQLKIRNRGKWGMAMLVLVCFTYVWEGIPYHKEIQKSLVKSPNVFDFNQLSPDFQKAVASFDASEYQTIFSLPFFYQGSEAFTIPRDEESVKKSIIMGYHSNLPMVGALLARTSIVESKKIVQLISPDYYDKPIAMDFPSQKPFLIVKASDDLSQNERDILDKCSLVYESDEVSLYKLELDDLFRSSVHERTADFEAEKPDLYFRDGLYVSDSLAFVSFNKFEGLESEIARSGKGAFRGTKTGKNVLAEFGPGTFDSAHTYDFSMWMHNGEPDALNGWLRLLIEEYDVANDQWTTTTFFPEFAETVDGNWSLMTGQFEVKNPGSHIYISTKGKERQKATLIVDDLLVKTSGVKVYVDGIEF